MSEAYYQRLLIMGSAFTIAGILWSGIAWFKLKQYAAEHDRPNLWDNANAYAPLVGVLIILPALYNSFPAVLQHNYKYILHRALVFWIGLTFAGYIYSMYWECESDLDTPDSLRPIADRWYK